MAGPGLKRGLDACLGLIDRNIYPEDEFPVGQWEYQRFYEENFAAAVAPFDADPMKAIKALFRGGDPTGKNKPSRTAFVRRDGGWFRGAAEPPDLPRDPDFISEADLCAYSTALTRNGFFGPRSYLMNHTANTAYADRAENDGMLEMPTLFIAGQNQALLGGIRGRPVLPGVYNRGGPHGYGRKRPRHGPPVSHSLRDAGPPE